MAIEWARCSCCWPQKPRIRKASGWLVFNADGSAEEVPPFWHLTIGGWPRGAYPTWEGALAAAYRYLERPP